MAKWQATKYPGVRFRIHETRKHGIGPDKYFVYNIRLGGKLIEEACGWGSEGMTAAKAAAIRAELKENHRRGEGVRTLREKREVETGRREQEESERKRDEADALTFSEFFTSHYLPLAEADKHWRTMVRERSFFKIWLNPAFGNKPLKNILTIDVERLKKSMAGAGQSPRSIEYALAVTRQVFNTARRLGMFGGSQPTEGVKRPRFDNRRDRFLSKWEADRLLEALKARGGHTYGMTLISLYAGLRISEIFNLTWGSVDLENGFLKVVDTKSGRNRNIPLSPILKEYFSGLPKGGPDSLLFPKQNGTKAVYLSPIFGKVVNELGFNDGVADTRQRITFHSMRHCFASWLAMAGCDMFTLQRLLGHETASMTARYSHLSPDTLKSAVALLESTMNTPAPAPLAVAFGTSEN